AAPHLGGMRREDRADRGGREEALELGARQAGVTHALQRIGHAALARRRGGKQMGAGSPNMVLVLSDVGEMREEAEGADDRNRLIERQAVERGGEGVA